MADSPPLPHPKRTPDTDPYWEAATEGVLLLRRSPSTGATEIGAAPAPAPDSEWIKASGRGQIYSFSIVRRHPDPVFNAYAPYPIALIDLEEGPRMLAHIVGPSALEAAIGDPVRCVFEARGDGVNAPQFLLDRD